MEELPSRQSDFTELADFKLEAATIRLLPLAFCHTYHVAVLQRHESERQFRLTVGMTDPQDERVLEMLTTLLKAQIVPVQLNTHEIHQALRVGYSHELPVDKSAGHMIDLQVYDNKNATSASTAPELVDHMLIEAVMRKASDIHLENYLADTDLRYRVEGILQQVFTHISLENIGEVINRLKVMAELDIAEQRRPQDGRFRCTFVDAELHSVVDFRINILPGPTGQDAVIRVLDPAAVSLQLEQLGMNQDIHETLTTLVNNPEGLILVTGPTGSGKTTTLYSALNLLRESGKKILTAEDPIEYYLDKINQKQVSPINDMAILARSFLRHDPDVMLIGEIRDHDTAETAIKAAATGHLVLSTLHTPDAIGAIQRLRSLGLEDDELANALLGILAQRLLRKVCSKCAEPVPATREQQLLLGDLAEGLNQMVGKGCSACNHSGYQGRTGIYEFLLIDEPMQHLVFKGSSSRELVALARSKGYRLMLEDALDKVAQGVTNLDEIFRVVPYRQIISAVSMSAL